MRIEIGPRVLIATVALGALAFNPLNLFAAGELWTGCVPVVGTTTTTASATPIVQPTASATPGVVDLRQNNTIPEDSGISHHGGWRSSADGSWVSDGGYLTPGIEYTWIP